MMNEGHAIVFSPGSPDGVSHAHGNACILGMFEYNLVSCVNFTMNSIDI